MQIFVNPHQSEARFHLLLTGHENRAPLICQLSGKCHSSLISKHQKLFQWHHEDTERSFTDLTVDGKFGYYKRITRHFKTDQEKLAIKTKGFVIGIWNPQTDNWQRTGMKPCLLSMKFVERGVILDLAVTFRSRDLLRRMIPNWIQLLKFLDKMALVKRRTPGTLYDFSYEAFYREEDKRLWLNAGVE